MKQSDGYATYFSRNGEYPAVLYASTPVSLIWQLKTIQHNEPCDTTCMRVHVVSPWRTGDIRLWQIGFGNVDRCNWRIDGDDFKALTGVSITEAEERYYDSVIG